MKIYGYTTGPIQVNTYLVFDETKHGFIVDPGGFSEEIVSKIEEEKVIVDYIILTHGHGDHIGGVAKFKDKYSQIQVLACADEEEMLKSPIINSSEEICGYPISMKADIYVQDGDTLDIGTMKLNFIHTPGHTQGGMCIILDGYVFSGDTLFKASIGRTDFPGGDFNKIVDSIRNKLFLLPDETIVLPGHMGQTTIKYEKEHNPFV